MRRGIKLARPRWLSLLVALGLIAALMPMSAALAEGQHSPPECDGLETTEADVATAPDGFIIDAICIKSGDDAFDEFASPEGPKHSVLITADGTYDGYVVSGIGTSQVMVDDDGAAHGLSHLDYRLVEEPETEPEGLLAVVKTAEGSFDRTHDWSITKSVDPEEIDLFIGAATETATWDIVVTYEGYEDGNFAVTGSIEITNGETLFNAEIDSVIDSLGNADCGVDLPDCILGPGATLTCDYSLDADEAGTNEVTVEGEYVEIADSSNTVPFQESDTADFDFEGDPTNEIHAMVNVADFSPLGDLLTDAYTDEKLTLDAADYEAGGTETFTYSYEFETEEDCGVFENTAKVIGDENEVLDEATASVTVNCFVFEGETVTGAGKSWSKISGAPNTWFQFTVGTGGTFNLVQGKKLVDVGDVTITGNELCFVLDDMELAPVSGNVKIQPLDQKPTSYLSPGQFSEHFTESGSSFCVEVEETGDYGYAIHLDAGQWVPLS